MCTAIGNGLIGAALCLGILCWGTGGSSESSVPADAGKEIRQACVEGGSLCGDDRRIAQARPASEAFGDRTVEPVMNRVAMNSVAMPSVPSALDGNEATGQEAMPAMSGAGEGGESGSSLVSRHVIAVLAALVGIVLLSRRRVS